MMRQEFEQHLADALAGLDQGQDIEAVLAQYPEEMDELAPLLETAAYARETLDFFEPPSKAGLAAGRRRMLEAAARKRTTAKRSWWRSALAALDQWLGTPSRGLATAILLLALLVVAGGATVVAAADSLPGDPLYGVKRAGERIRLTLTTDPAARADLRARFNRERQAEAQAVAAMGRQARLRFEGVLEQRLDDTWVVDGMALIVEPGAVEGEPAVGSTVVVDVVSPGDGSLHVRHMSMRPGPHMPASPTMSPGGRGPMPGPDRTAPSATPTTDHGMPATRVAPAPMPTETHAPATPMSTEDMESGQQHGPQQQPTHGPMGPGMEPATASPQPMHEQTGSGMGQAPATPVPTQVAPAPEPSHPGPMMPHPTEAPHRGAPHPSPPPGSGHPGGPGGGGHHRP